MSTDVHTLSGAYALDALGPEEAAEFRAHLDVCQACRDEVRELQHVAGRLGAAEAQPPPPELRERILAAAARTPQLPPPSPRESTRPEPTHNRWFSRLAVAAAAVVLVGGGALGVRALVDDNAPQLPVAASQVFDAEDARTRAVTTENGGTLVVGVAPSRGEMAIDTRKLPRLDADHVYQLWVQVGEGMRSVGVLGATDTGAAMEMPEEGVAVAVTVEPDGGSEQPTTEPIAVVEPADL